jgi:tetratricopeptide (TPR) repeat protein
MLECNNRWFLILAAVGSLLGGCTATAPRQPAAADPRLLQTQDVNQTLVDAHAHYLAGMVHDLAGEQELAEDDLTKSANEDPSNSELVLELSQRLLQERKPEIACDLVKKSASLPDAPGAIFARLGLLYTHLGRQAEAVAACQTAIARAPELMDGYRILYLLYAKSGKPKDALVVLNKASSVSKVDEAFSLELAELYDSLQRLAPSEARDIKTNALKALSRIPEQDNPDPRLRLHVADLFGQFGDLTNATRIYLDLIEQHKDDAELRLQLHDRLAVIFLTQNNAGKAEEHLEGILKDDPVNVKVYFALGSVAEEQKKYAEALDCYHKCVLLNENFEPAYYSLARMQLDSDKIEDARATLAKAQSKFPQGFGFTGEVLSALLCEKRKEFTNAVGHFDAAESFAAKTDPEKLSGGFYFDQGAALEQAGIYDRAEVSLQKSIAMIPDFAEALNYLGYMWADRGVKLDQALDLIQKAVKLEPDSPAYLDSLGWVLFKLNRPKEAIEQLLKAMHNSPEPDATILDHAGDIYAALNQLDNARDSWTKSLSLEPNEKIRQKLERSGGTTTH